MKLYIVRHGKTEWNKEKRMQGQQDSPLTKEGILNAESLSKKLADIKLDAIYSSSCGRAYNTAKIINQPHKLNITQKDELREISLGKWEGKLMSELDKTHSEQHSNFWKSPHIYDPSKHGGESFFDIRKRVVNELKKIISNHDTGNILLVSHTVVIKSILHHLMNIDVKKLWEENIILPTSLSIIDFNSKTPEFITIGDMSHAVTQEKGSNGFY